MWKHTLHKLVRLKFLEWMRLVSTYPSLSLAVSAFATAKGRQSRDCKHKVIFQKHWNHNTWNIIYLLVFLFQKIVLYHTIWFNIQWRHHQLQWNNTDSLSRPTLRIQFSNSYTCVGQLKKRDGFTRFCQNVLRELKCYPLYYLTQHIETSLFLKRSL